MKMSGIHWRNNIENICNSWNMGNTGFIEGILENDGNDAMHCTDVMLDVSLVWIRQGVFLVKFDLQNSNGEMLFQ